jgi:hypothetical protein
VQACWEVGEKIVDLDHAAAFNWKASASNSYERRRAA